ncbi:MAG: 50S ribosomal protein L9 [Candidatus Paceibacterota bacterium]
MKIYLLKDVEKVGRKGEIKEVKDGFALNYLIPKKLAVVADEKLIKQLEKEKKERAEIEEKEKKEKILLKKKIEEMTLTIPLKFLKEEGKAYDAVNKQRIKEELKKSKIDIEENQILLEKSLKKEGDYEVILDLGYQIKAKLKIKIVPSKE